MQKVLVLGYGNPLRGDDAFGWYVADLLAREYQDDEQIRVMACHQLTPDLAETLSHFESVVFIDVSCEQTEEIVRCVQLEPKVSSTMFSHHVTPSTLLITSEILYGWLPRAFMVSIMGKTFGLGEEMSPQVRSQIPGILNRIREVVNSPWTVEQDGLSPSEHHY